ncbi:hypothetical protein GF342_05425 [Candidatus Woesearchaeota archaeon]|nr:hypothetical protein [Candidatus Woesearchaeota archaeon]
MKHRRLEVFLEFLFFGLVMGITEDLIALKFATGEPLTWKIILIVFLVALPFAIIGELIVDRVRWWRKIRRTFQKHVSSVKSSRK